MPYKLGVDLDGVTADFDRHWRVKYQEWFGGELLEQNGEWNAIVDQTHFTSEGEFWAWVNNVPNFWESMPPIPGAWGAILDLARAGNEIVFITSRHSSTRAATETWLKRFWPLNIHRPRLHFVGKTSKGSIEVQIYVDDNPVVLEALRGRPCVLIFDQPWNKDVKTGGGTHRIKGWDALRKFVLLLDRPEDELTDVMDALEDPEVEPAKAAAK